MNNETTMLITILIFIGIAGVGVYTSESSYNRLMRECLQAGHQEYECYGILRGRR